MTPTLAIDATIIGIWLLPLAVVLIGASLMLADVAQHLWALRRGRRRGR